VKLIITGKVNPKVLALAQQVGVGDRLILPGFIPKEELSWCLGSANMFLLPFPDTIYNRGRWPNKIGLYLCLGRPVVTNLVGDLVPLLREVDIGYSAEYNAQDFARGIVRLLEDPAAAQRLGANARQAAETRCNWSVLIQDLENFYYRILAFRENKT